MFDIFDLYHIVMSVFICNFLTGHCWIRVCIFLVLL